MMSRLRRANNAIAGGCWQGPVLSRPHACCVPVRTLRGAERQVSGLPELSLDGCVVQTEKAPDVSSAFSARARPRLVGFAKGQRRSLPRVTAAVSDERILAFVAAAQGLSQRQRNRYADVGSAAADERLLRLEWAVQAGRLVLADRAARALTSTAVSAQGRRVDR